MGDHNELQTKKYINIKVIITVMLMILIKATDSRSRHYDAPLDTASLA